MKDLPLVFMKTAFIFVNTIKQELHSVRKKDKLHNQRQFYLCILKLENCLFLRFEMKKYLNWKHQFLSLILPFSLRYLRSDAMVTEFNFPCFTFN